MNAKLLDEYENMIIDQMVPKMRFMWKAQAKFKEVKETIDSELGIADKHFFITIRPDEKKTDFITFNNQVVKFLNRKMSEDYTVSFEQKGHHNGRARKRVPRSHCSKVPKA